ncbi:MAG: potassium-transporting ATPase subunit KdpC [Calditrichaceae bacterium]|nr:potassium-transporting ATPase subunit KdpC [Calditrichia bacterium]NUQ41109.1 potassium-transporting ATPase subunit KdpC [Calditrichaceae bacterium]
MKAILKDLKLHFATLILFGLLFPLLIWAIGLLFPHQSNGLPIYKEGKLIGFENIGQKFYSDKYFWGRPSAMDYNGASTGGSNKGPTNPEYLAQVEERIQQFLDKNPGVKRSEIPSELVTASGSGLDPHISPQGARIQVARVAAARNLDPERVRQLVESHIEAPLLGLFGTARVNVLKLNLALDEMDSGNNTDKELKSGL